MKSSELGDPAAGQYAVVWPLAARHRGRIEPAARPHTLAGRRIGLLWNEMFDGDLIFEQVKCLVSSRFEGAVFVAPEAFGNFHGRDEFEVVQKLPDALRRERIESVVVGVGGSGTDTAAVMRVCALAEEHGISAVAVIASGFLREASAIARAQGIPHVVVAEYPGQTLLDSAELVRTKSREQVAPAVLAGLLGVSADTRLALEQEPSPREIICSGHLDQVQEYFEARLWTDGLPIVPPTIERVEAFLAHVKRDPQEAIAVLPPEQREATVWSVAVNGVMAGCRPEYMPVLVAIVKALAEPGNRLQDAGSTPGWEPVVILSGPVVKRLDLNYEGGMMRVGRRSNTSIGRFVRLFMRNVCGFLTPPGATDVASIGLSFNVAMAENDDALSASGWPSLRVERGFATADSVVTLQSVIGISQAIYTSGNDPASHLEFLAYMMQSTSAAWVSCGLIYDHYHPLLLLSPSVAALFARHGLTKDDVRSYLYAHSKVEARWLDAVARNWGDSSTLSTVLKSGRVPAAFTQSDDPRRLVPSLLRPESTTIVVGGDPLRNQSRIYINNHAQLPPVSRRIEFLDC